MFIPMEKEYLSHINNFQIARGLVCNTAAHAGIKPNLEVASVWKSQPPSYLLEKLMWWPLQEKYLNVMERKLEHGIASESHKNR